jgi:assimilatory nitrate reductase catalytic subunit
MSDDNPIVCFCLQVDRDTILESIRDGARSVAEVQRACRACTGCQSCYPDVEDLIEEVEREQA